MRVNLCQSFATKTYKRGGMLNYGDVLLLS